MNIKNENVPLLSAKQRGLPHSLSLRQAKELQMAVFYSKISSTYSNKLSLTSVDQMLELI